VLVDIEPPGTSSASQQSHMIAHIFLYAVRVERNLLGRIGGHQQAVDGGLNRFCVILSAGVPHVTHIKNMGAVHRAVLSHTDCLLAENFATSGVFNPGSSDSVENLYSNG